MPAPTSKTRRLRKGEVVVPVVVKQTLDEVRLTPTPREGDESPLVAFARIADGHYGGQPGSWSYEFDIPDGPTLTIEVVD